MAKDPQRCLPCEAMLNPTTHDHVLVAHGRDRFRPKWWSLVKEGAPGHATTGEHGGNLTMVKKTWPNELRHDRGKSAWAKVEGQPPYLAWRKVDDPLEGRNLELTCPTLTQWHRGSSWPQKKSNAQRRNSSLFIADNYKISATKLHTRYKNLAPPWGWNHQ
jgi:hypothetical protein